MITNETVTHLASLAHISITNEETDSLKNDLEKILAYVEDINSVDTEINQGGVSQVAGSNVVREDEITNDAGVYTEKLVALAPQKEGDYFTVKKILSHND